MVDHPFDDARHFTAGNRLRVDELIARWMRKTTIVRLPRCFSEDEVRELRGLVILNGRLDG